MPSKDSYKVFNVEAEDFAAQVQTLISEAEPVEITLTAKLIGLMIKQNQSNFENNLKAFEGIYDRCDKIASKAEHSESRLMRLEGAVGDMARMEGQQAQALKEKEDMFQAHQQKFANLKPRFLKAFAGNVVMENWFQDATDLIELSYRQREGYAKANYFEAKGIWQQCRLRGARVGGEDQSVIEELKAKVEGSRLFQDDHQATGDRLMVEQSLKEKELLNNWSAPLAFKVWNIIPCPNYMSPHIRLCRASWGFAELSGASCQA